MTMALSMPPPSARPWLRSISTSLVKPKVRARAMSRVVVLTHVELHTLARGVYGRMGKVDLEAQLEAVVGVEACPLEVLALALAHLDGADDPDEALGSLLQLDARALQQEHEGGGGAVEDGHFLGGDVYIDVVEPEAGNGRHQVLHGMHLGAA